MQISRCLLAASVVVALLPIVLRADTEAQIKARQALEQKLNEIEVQPAKAAPKAAPVTKPAATKAAPPTAPAQPAPQATATESGFAPQVQSQVPTADSAAIAKAREAMRQKVRELQPDVTSPSAAVPAATGAAAASSAAVETATATAPQPSSSDSRFSEVPNLPSANTDSLSKARDAMRQTAVTTAASPARTQVENQPLPTMASTPPPPAAPAPPPSKPSKFPPLPPPDLPISADKNQKLADLLQRYKADQITPEEYHSERAKILAGK